LVLSQLPQLIKEYLRSLSLVKEESRADRRSLSLRNQRSLSSTKSSKKTVPLVLRRTRVPTKGKQRRGNMRVDITQEKIISHNSIPIILITSTNNSKNQSDQNHQNIKPIPNNNIIEKMPHPICKSTDPQSTSDSLFLKRNHCKDSKLSRIILG
jgi:hypothetical protein